MESWHFGRGTGRPWLAIEYVLLFLGLPLLLALAPPKVPWYLPLFAVALFALIWLSRGGEESRRDIFWSERISGCERRELRNVLLRFAVLGSALVIAVAIVEPSRITSLPWRTSSVWLMLAILYPFFSAFPQELIYRAFFFRRYRALFSPPWLLVAANTLAFAWMHIIYHNSLAVILTIGGGYCFASTYRRCLSLRLVWLEHTLYGVLIFSVGLGEFFIHGSQLPR